MWLIQFCFFFQTDTLWMGDSPEFHRADLVITPDSAEWAILLKLIFTVVEQWEWKWNELWNLQYFPPRKLNCSAPVTCSVLCESRCCSSSPQENFHVMSSRPLACAADGWFARGKSGRKLLTAKWRLRWNWNEAAGENTGDPAASWEMCNHGDSWGSCGHGVWQSGHNSGLIHHMGIMLLAGTTTEILHSLPPSNRKYKQSPPPQALAVSAWEETGQMNKNYWLEGEKKPHNIYLRPSAAVKVVDAGAVKAGLFFFVHTLPLVLFIISDKRD